VNALLVTEPNLRFSVRRTPMDMPEPHSRKRRRVERDNTCDDEDDPCDDAVDTVYVPVPFKGGLKSPTMMGKTVDMFRDKDVMYLLTFRKDAAATAPEVYIKFGRTQDVERRMRTHLLDYPDAQVWCIHDCACSMFDLENRFKTRMRHLGHLVELEVNGKRKVEILQSIQPSDAEQVLLSIKEELESNDERRLMMQHIHMRTIAYKSSVLQCVKSLLDAPITVAELKTLIGMLF